MLCPSCNQPASTFFRFFFTREGVSIAEGIKGHLRCQHCGTLLRIARFRKQLWYLVAALAIAIFAFLLVFVKPLIAGIGVRGTLWGWIGFVFVWVLFFTIGLWRYRVFEKVNEESKSAQKAMA